MIFQFWKKQQQKTKQKHKKKKKKSKMIFCLAWNTMSAEYKKVLVFNFLKMQNMVLICFLTQNVD